MKKTDTWTGLALALLATLLAAGPGTQPLRAGDDPNLLFNPSLETFSAPYGAYPPDGRPLQVAEGWQRFWNDGPGWSEPYWMDAYVFGNGGWWERIHGWTSQCLFSDQPFDAGLYQSVTGLIPGRGYGFNAPMTSIYQTAYPPQEDAKIFKQVGLDLTGGTDPDAPTVLWSEPNGQDGGWQLHLRIAALAETPTATVFMRITSPEPAGPFPFLNQSWLDSAFLAQTPAVTATSPLTTAGPAFTVSWEGAQPAPGGTLQKYDLQAMDETEGVWRDWLTDTVGTSAVFTGDWGHRYHFRARAWQAYDSSAWLHGPYRADGDTVTEVLSARLSGRVTDIWDRPVVGATVAVSGTAFTTSTRPDGTYLLYTPSLSGPQAVAAAHRLFGPLPPSLGVSLPLNADVQLDFALPPLSDAAVNGGFEDGLVGWQVLTGTWVVTLAHTGAGALAAGPPPTGTWAITPAVVATTTFPISGLVEPALSLWVHPLNSEPEGRLNLWLNLVTSTLSATLPLTPSHIFTLDLSVAGWSHAWFPLGGPGQVLSGTAMLRVVPGEASAVLDEVVLGGIDRPRRLYLPLVVRQEHR